MEMFNWTAANFFPPDLLICKNTKEEFNSFTPMSSYGKQTVAKKPELEEKPKGAYDSNLSSLIDPKLLGKFRGKSNCYSGKENL
jgi:hypothetical protein